MTNILQHNLNDFPVLHDQKTKDFTLVMPLIHVEQPDVSTEQDAYLGQKEYCPDLSRPLRKLMFNFCNVLGIICYGFVTQYYNVIFIFQLWYISASVFFILSMIFLWGPTDFLKRICTLQGAVFTLIYGSAIYGGLCLYCWYGSIALLVISMIVQITILLWFIISNIPGGRDFVRLLLIKMFEKIDNLLPIT